MFRKWGSGMLARLEAIQRMPLIAAALIFAAFVGGVVTFSESVGKIYEATIDKIVCPGCPHAKTTNARGADLFVVQFDRQINTKALFRVHHGILLGLPSAQGLVIGTSEPLEQNERLRLEPLPDQEIARDLTSGSILRRVDLAELARAMPASERPPSLANGVYAEIVRRLRAAPITDCDSVHQAALLIGLLPPRPTVTLTLPTRAEIELLRFTYECPSQPSRGTIGPGFHNGTPIERRYVWAAVARWRALIRGSAN